MDLAEITFGGYSFLANAANIATMPKYFPREGGTYEEDIQMVAVTPLTCTFPWRSEYSPGDTGSIEMEYHGRILSIPEAVFAGVEIGDENTMLTFEWSRGGKVLTGKREARVIENMADEAIKRLVEKRKLTRWDLLDI